MSEKDVLLPDIGDFDSVEVVELMVSVGDQVEKEDSLLSLESDKATMEIPAPFSGTVVSINVALGDKIAQGDLIMVVNEVSETTSTEPQTDSPPLTTEVIPEKPPEPTRPIGDKPPAPTPTVAVEATDFSSNQSHATPSIRRFARELGVDLSQITGSGRKGRIAHTDVQNFVKHVMSGNTSAPSTTGHVLPPVPKVDFASFGEIQEQPLSRIKKLSGAHLHGCWLNIPHVTQFDEADITDLEVFRKQMKDEAAARGAKLTPMPFIMKAVVTALQAMPEFNSSLSADGENLIIKQYLNIGVAVNTPNGLVVPVIKDVDKKSIYDLAIELMEVSSRARDGKLSPKDMQGGTFTISSLGGIGGTGFTPIVNSPEVAILGLSRSAIKPIWDGKVFQPKMIMPFSLSYDHRVIDGVQGVTFTSLLSRLLGDIRRILL